MLNRSVSLRSDTRSVRRLVVSIGAALIFIYSEAGLAATPDITHFYAFGVPIKIDKDVYGYGVNDLGAVVGKVADTKGGQNSFYLYRGVASEFQFPNAQVTVANTINNSNEICGTYQTTSGWNGFCWNSSSGYVSYQVPISANVTANYTAFNSINNHGVIVGTFQIPGSQNYHGLYTTDKINYTRIDFPGASNTFVSGINDSDQVVGYYQDGNGLSRGFEFVAGRYTDVAVPGCSSTIPTGINNQNYMVGICQSAKNTSTSFVRDGAGNVKLFNAAGFKSNTLAQSLALNTPQIVGFATQADNLTGGWVTGSPPWPANNSQIPQSLFGMYFWGRPDLTGQFGPDGVPLGQIRDVELLLRSDGTVVFLVYLEIREDLGRSFTCITKSYSYYPTGSFNVQFYQLHFTVQGTYTLNNNCNTAMNTTTPTRGTFDFTWEEGIAIGGKTYLWAPMTGLGALENNILMVKQKQ
jgi:hypothetical protein